MDIRISRRVGPVRGFFLAIGRSAVLLGVTCGGIVVALRKYQVIDSTTVLAGAVFSITSILIGLLVLLFAAPDRR